MNESKFNPEDALLEEHLRHARPSPPLPPRFRENVWRRIESEESSTLVSAWLERLAELVLRPRLAVATVAVLVVAGALLGVQSGNEVSRRDAQVRYVAAVAPNLLH